MTTDEILAYIGKTPENTNFNILRELLNNMEGGGPTIKSISFHNYNDNAVEIHALDKDFQFVSESIEGNSDVTLNDIFGLSTQSTYYCQKNGTYLTEWTDEQELFSVNLIPSFIVTDTIIFNSNKSNILRSLAYDASADYPRPITGQAGYSGTVYCRGPIGMSNSKNEIHIHSSNEEIVTVGAMEGQGGKAYCYAALQFISSGQATLIATVDDNPGEEYYIAVIVTGTNQDSGGESTK